MPVSSVNGNRKHIQVLYEDSAVNTEYVALDATSNIIVKGPWSAEFIQIDHSGVVRSYRHNEKGFKIQTIAMGGLGFDKNTLFGTQMPSGVIFKIVLP